METRHGAGPAARARYRINYGALARDRPLGFWALTFVGVAGANALLRDAAEAAGWVPGEPAGRRLLFAVTLAACVTTFEFVRVRRRAPAA